MFKAGDRIRDNEIVDDNYYVVGKFEEVLTENGWKEASKISKEDILIGDNNRETIKEIVEDGSNYKIYVI